MPEQNTTPDLQKCRDQKAMAMHSSLTAAKRYCDKPCEYVDPEDEAEPSNMLQEFLNSISDDDEDEVPGCAFKGVGIPSQSYYNVSEVISNATLEDIKSVLECNGLNCKDTYDGNLICEWLKL
ncbi:uncharacterized protein LOC120702624 isoform X2 [Panicum virgatum]|uniref:Uncharacterized protein n=1 Tax=Panicum virgatum TaxID=38727 RepID=A0A8T0TEM6_PANVG|nr:uncharacterized protein LOC120702624 isoform X2 [Panicum virgatum]KAG2609420.1 hypothetical protein PVAP13_4KG038000 [Panicum virgatum]